MIVIFVNRSSFNLLVFDDFVNVGRTTRSSYLETSLLTSILVLCRERDTVDKNHDSPEITLQALAPLVVS